MTLCRCEICSSRLGHSGSWSDAGTRRGGNGPVWFSDNTRDSSVGSSSSGTSISATRASLCGKENVPCPARDVIGGSHLGEDLNAISRGRASEAQKKEEASNRIILHGRQNQCYLNSSSNSQSNHRDHNKRNRCKHHHHYHQFCRQHGHRDCPTHRHQCHLGSSKFLRTTTSLSIISFLLLISSLPPGQASSVSSKTRVNVVSPIKSNRGASEDYVSQARLLPDGREYIGITNIGETRNVDNSTYNDNGIRRPALLPVILANNNLPKAHVGDQIGTAGDNDKNAIKVDEGAQIGPLSGLSAPADHEAGSIYANRQLSSSDDQIKQPQERPSLERRRARRSNALSAGQSTSAPDCHDCLAIPLVAIVGRKQLKGFIIQSASRLHNRQNHSLSSQRNHRHHHHHHHHQRDQQQQQQTATTSIQSEAPRPGVFDREQEEQQSGPHRDYSYEAAAATSAGSRDEQQRDQGYFPWAREQHQKPIGNQPAIYAPSLMMHSSQNGHDSSRGVYGHNQEYIYTTNGPVEQHGQQHSPLPETAAQLDQERCTLTVCDQINSYPTDVIFNKLEHAKKLFGQIYFDFDSFFSDERHFSSEPFDDVHAGIPSPNTVCEPIRPVAQIESQYTHDDEDDVNEDINTDYGRSTSAGNLTANGATARYATKSRLPIGSDGHDDRQEVVSTGPLARSGGKSQYGHLDAASQAYRGDSSQRRVAGPKLKPTKCCGWQEVSRAKLNTSVTELVDSARAAQEHRSTRESNSSRLALRAREKALPSAMLNNLNNPTKSTAVLRRNDEQQRQPTSAGPSEDFLYLVERQGIRMPSVASLSIEHIIGSEVDDHNKSGANNSVSAGVLKSSTILSRTKRQPDQTRKLQPNGGSRSKVAPTHNDSNDGSGSTTKNYDDRHNGGANYNQPERGGGEKRVARALVPLGPVVMPSLPVKLGSDKIATDSQRHASDGQPEVADSGEQTVTGARLIRPRMTGTMSNSRASDDKTVMVNGGKVPAQALSVGGGGASEVQQQFTRHRGGFGRFTDKRNSSIINTSLSALNGHMSLGADKIPKGPTEVNETEVKSRHGRLLIPTSQLASTSLTLETENKEPVAQFARYSLGAGHELAFKDIARNRLRRQVVSQGEPNDFSASGRDDQGSEPGSQDDSSSGEQIQPICRARSIYISPRAALNDKKQWKYVVNTPERDPRVRQIIRVDVCENPFEPCSAQITLPLGFTSQCKQKYAKKKLLAWNSRTGSLEVDTFFIPSCCVCQLILDTGSDSTSPLTPPSSVDDEETRPLADNNDEPQTSPISSPAPGLNSESRADIAAGASSSINGDQN